MSNHVTEWLNAYLDGELKGHRLQQVEQHLLECQLCRGDYQSLQDLSAVLHDVQAPGFTSPERFASQVSLKLPHELPKATGARTHEAGWWMIPVSLLAIWLLIATFVQVSSMISTAGRFGMFKDAPAWLVQSSSVNEETWSGLFGEYGLLSGTNLEWAEGTEIFTKNTLSQITWQASLALLYLSWIAIWWARQTSRENGQLLEG
jgi:predicted anti-sigma-YlaC factor YlaD